MIKRALSAAVMLAALTTPVSQALAERVDINSASRGDLMRIVHIDKVRSANVIKLRERQPFDDGRDLMRQKGSAHLASWI